MYRPGKGAIMPVTWPPGREMLAASPPMTGSVCRRSSGNRHESTPRHGHLRSGKQLSHSITSSARARTVCGTVNLIVFAVFRLRTNSYLVGSCTGSAAGCSPRRIRST